jgi:hypothetical protein
MKGESGEKKPYAYPLSKLEEGGHPETHGHGSHDHDHDDEADPIGQALR